MDINTSYSLVFNRKRKLKKNGTAQIEVCAYFDGKRKYIPTGVYVTPLQWNEKQKKVKDNSVIGFELQKQCNEKINELRAFEWKRKAAGKPFALDNFNELLQGKDFDKFTDFVQSEIENDKVSTRTTIVNKTTTYKTLKAFRKDITFAEISGSAGFELLKNFENYLIGKENIYNKDKGLSANTRNKYFRHLKAFVNSAINKGYMQQNDYPFRNFHAKTEQTRRDFLSPEELQIIENLEFTPENAHLIKIQDMFLFSCYTGLRFSDIAAVSKDNLQPENDVLYLSMKMQKTKNYIKIPISVLRKPVEILRKYEQPDKNYYFDDLTNQYVNRALKEIAALAGVKKHLTFHVARHTCATFLLSKGVSLPVIQSFLGHTKIQTTQIYAKMLNTTMINELSNVQF